MGAYGSEGWALSLSERADRFHHDMREVLQASHLATIKDVNLHHAPILRRLARLS